MQINNLFIVLAERKSCTQNTHTQRERERDTPGQFCNHILFAATKNYEMPSMIFHLFCKHTVCVCVCDCVRVCVCVGTAVSSPSSSSSGPDNDGGRLMLCSQKTQLPLGPTHSTYMWMQRRRDAEARRDKSGFLEKVIYARCVLYLPTCCTRICPT